MIALFARAGREALTARTLALLDAAGATSTSSERVIWWSGEKGPPEAPGWRVVWRVGPPRGSVADWFAFIKTARGGDLHVFEDDVIPCRNLIPYVERRPVEWFTTYFNPWGAPVGQACALRGGLGFDCSQAMSIPARLVDRMADGPDLGDVGRLGHDCVMSRLLQRWGEPVLWDRTLVQHTAGDSANGWPRPFWLRDSKWVGADFDALTIPTRAAGPVVSTSAYFLGVRPAVDQRNRPPAPGRFRRW